MRYTLVDFVRESNHIEGIHREPTDAEIEAHIDFLEADKISVEHFELFVSVVQPNAVLRRRKLGYTECLHRAGVAISGRLPRYVFEDAFGGLWAS